MSLGGRGFLRPRRGKGKPGPLDVDQWLHKQGTGKGNGRMDNPEEQKPKAFDGLVTVDLKNNLVSTLRDSEGNFRVLVDLLPICLLGIRGGKIIYANPGLLRLLGYEKAEELIGQS